MKTRHPRLRERFNDYFRIDPDRPIYTHGPIVRTIVIMIVLSSLVAAAGFAFSIITYGNRLDAIQTSRVESAADTCRTLRTVIRQAYRPQRAARPTFHAVINGKQAILTLEIPKSQARTGEAQIKADDLVDCAARARKITALNR